MPPTTALPGTSGAERANRRALLIAAFAILLGVAGAFTFTRSAENDGAQRSDQLKAAYLFKFVEWPASVPADVLTVCFVGSDGVHDAHGFARSTGLRISSNLLQLAAAIEKGGGK